MVVNCLSLVDGVLLVGCWWWVVCHLWLVVCCCVLVVYCWLMAAACVLFVVGCVLSVVCASLRVVGCWFNFKLRLVVGCVFVCC